MVHTCSLPVNLVRLSTNPDLDLGERVFDWVEMGLRFGGRFNMRTPTRTKPTAKLNDLSPWIQALSVNYLERQQTRDE
jgi:hypothetical protein